MGSIPTVASNPPGRARDLIDRRQRGVVCTQEPAERPYAIEAVSRDDSGNWLSLTGRR